MTLDSKRTALVVIDLQEGIVALDGAPHGTKDVVARAALLADAFRSQGAFVVLVNVGSKDGGDMLKPLTDQTIPPRPRSADFMRLVPELKLVASDHLITKHQWGALYGTDLDLQLRRRKIDTIVLCGISTNIGVETTAREAYQAGYEQIFVEDAMTALSAEEHNHSLRYIFPRLGRVRSTSEVISAIQA